jgi:hypothetical protein
MADDRDALMMKVRALLSPAARARADEQDARLEKERERLRDIARRGGRTALLSGRTGSVVGAIAFLSPTILATLFVLYVTEPLLVPFFFLAVQMLLLYDVLKPIEPPRFPTAATGESLRFLQELADLHLEGQRRRRRVLWYCAPVALAAFAAALVFR